MIIVSTLRSLLTDKKFRFGFIVIIILVFLAILSLLSPYNLTYQYEVPPGLPPSLHHLLGTDLLGKDVFWEITAAIKNSLIIATVCAILSRVIAIIVALIAGFKGKWIDRILMSFNDSFIVLPLLPLLILVASVFKGLNDVELGVVLAVFGWAWDARTIRSQVLSLKERGYTYTALMSGMGTLGILRKEYLPFLIPLIFSTILSNMLWAIGMEITLSVLGLTNLNIPTLGTMLYWAVNRQAIFLGLWWWILTPLFVAVVLFVSLYLISISISEYLDPRTRTQRISVTKGMEGEAN